MKVQKAFYWLLLFGLGILALSFQGNLSLPLVSGSHQLEYADPTVQLPVYSDNTPLGKMEIGAVASDHSNYLPFVTVPSPGGIFYISPNGNDAASGISPAQAWACRSDWAIPNSRSPEMTALMLNTEPPVDSTVTLSLYSSYYLLTILLTAPPAG